MGYSCIFLKKKKKKGFDFNDSKWIFEIYFQRDLLRKIFSFKIKEINMKTTEHKKQNSKKTKSQSKIFDNQAN